MFWRRIGCLFGLHTWGRWVAIRDIQTAVELYRQRRCLVCGCYQDENTDALFHF